MVVIWKRRPRRNTSSTRSILRKGMGSRLERGWKARNGSRKSETYATCTPVIRQHYATCTPVIRQAGAVARDGGARRVHGIAGGRRGDGGCPLRRPRAPVMQG